MIYGAPPKERSRSDRIKHAFSFHLGDQVLEGRDLSADSLSVYCPLNFKDGQFYFYKGQNIKDCFIQIEGKTFYFTCLHVTRLEKENNIIVYGIQIDFIIPQEQQRYEAFYSTLTQSADKSGSHQ